MSAEDIQSIHGNDHYASSRELVAGVYDQYRTTASMSCAPETEPQVTLDTSSQLTNPSLIQNYAPPDSQLTAAEADHSGVRRTRQNISSSMSSLSTTSFSTDLDDSITFRLRNERLANDRSRDCHNVFPLRSLDAGPCRDRHLEVPVQLSAPSCSPNCRPSAMKADCKRRKFIPSTSTDEGDDRLDCRPRAVDDDNQTVSDCCAARFARPEVANNVKCKTAGTTCIMPTAVTLSTSVADGPLSPNCLFAAYINHDVLRTRRMTL